MFLWKIPATLVPPFCPKLSQPTFRLKAMHLRPLATKMTRENTHSSSSGSQPSSAPCIEKVWRTIHLASSSEIEELENRFKSRDAKIWKSASSFLPLPEGPKVGTLSAVRFMVPEPRSYFIRSVVTVKNDQGKERKGILFLIYKAKQVTQALTYGVVLFEAGNEELVPLDDDGSTVCSTHPLEVASSDEFLSFSQAKVMPLIPRWIQNLHSKSFSSSDECKILSSKRSRTPRQISDPPSKSPPKRRRERSRPKPRATACIESKLLAHIARSEAKLLKAVSGVKSSESMHSRATISSASATADRALSSFREDREKERLHIERILTLQHEISKSTSHSANHPTSLSESILDEKLSVRQLLELREAFKQ